MLSTILKKISIKKNQQLFINGLAKGSGMIAPNMATMLSFIITNANLSSKNCLKSSKNVWIKLLIQ